MKMSIRSQNTFVLGVGAQKAGTSWLHHQLASRADTDFGFLKEYHVFDVIFHSEYEYFTKASRPVEVENAEAE